MSHGVQDITDPHSVMQDWSVERIAREGQDASFCRLMSASVDLALKSAFAGTEQAFESICVMASGGYGRFELTPGSDVDLWVVVDEGAEGDFSGPLASFSRAVSEAGFVPAVRYFSRLELLEQLREDMKLRVSCFDVRVLAGDESGVLTKAVETAVLLHEPSNTMRFLRSETEERREEFRSHWFLQEPNLKLSEGGLRDLHAIRWIQRLLSKNGLEIPEDQKTTLVESHRFLLWLRALLHSVVKENKDTLSFSAQAALAELDKRRLDSEEEQQRSLLDQYHEHARHVAWTLRRWLAWGDEWFHTRGAATPPDRNVPGEEGVVVRGGRLGLVNQGDDAVDPVCGLRLYRVVADTGLKLHHTAFLDIKRSLQASLAAPDQAGQAASDAVLMDLICLPDYGTRALEGAHDAGILDRCFPALSGSRDTSKPIHDRLYTQDIHGLRSIDALKRIHLKKTGGDDLVLELLQGGYATDAALFTALFFLPCVQAKKVDREKLSSELTRFCASSGQGGSLAGEVLFLVEHYASFVRKALSPDWSNRALGRSLARDISSTEQLDRLYLMAFANMAVSNPAMMTSWQYAQIKSLYGVVRERMTSGLGLWSDRDEIVREMSLRTVRFMMGHTPLAEDPTRSRIERHFSRLPTRYAKMVGPQDVRLHIDLLEGQESAQGQGVSLRFRPSPRGATGSREAAFSSGRKERVEVVLASVDSPNLLSGVCGGLTQLGANIRRAYVFRTLDDLVLLVFVVEGLQPGAAQGDALKITIDERLRGAVSTEPSTTAVQERGSQEGGCDDEVNVDLESAEESDVLSLEVRGGDRAGFLFDLVCATKALRLELVQIYLWTEGALARGKILLCEQDGSRPTGQARIDEILSCVRATFAKAPKKS